MSKWKCKGTALQQQIAGSYVAVSQIISLGGPELESETFEADTVDNAAAGIPYQPTGRTEGGSLSGEMFYDPALDAHKDLLELLRAPAAENWKIIFADTDASEWTFAGAGFGFNVTVALNDGLKGSFSIKLDGIPTFPSGGSAS